jgi:hypothetical protein
MAGQHILEVVMDDSSNLDKSEDGSSLSEIEEDELNYEGK